MFSLLLFCIYYSFILDALFCLRKLYLFVSMLLNIINAKHVKQLVIIYLLINIYDSRSTMLRRMLDPLSLALPAPSPSSSPSSSSLSPLSVLVSRDQRQGRGYRSLLSRPTSSSLEERLKLHQSKRRREEERKED